MKTVRLVWIDSTLLEGGGWMDVEHITLKELGLDALRQEATGYLVGESEDAVAIATCRNASEEIADRNETRFAGVVVIPRRCILEEYELRDAPRRRKP